MQVERTQCSEPEVEEVLLSNNGSSGWYSGILLASPKRPASRRAQTGVRRRLASRRTRVPSYLMKTRSVPLQYSTSGGDGNNKRRQL
jgi:hypothetical protein